MMGRAAINDRLFVTNSMGYTHMGHNFKSNMPKKESEEVKEGETPKKDDKVCIGDDLGSLNYLLA